VTPDERRHYERPLPVQLNWIQSNVNCGMVTVDALIQFLELLGWCCKNLRNDDRR